MEYHLGRFDDASLMVFKEKSLVAILPLHQDSKNVYSHLGLTYGGLAVGPTIKFSEYLDIFLSVLEYLNDKGFSKLFYKPIPKPYCILPSDEIDYLLFLCNAKLIRADISSTIFLDKPLKIQSNRMEGVKKAKKKGLSIKEDQNFKDFWEGVLIPNLDNKHQSEPTHSLKEIQLLASNFPENIRQFNVYDQERLVGGATIFDHGHHVHVQYIAGGLDKQQLGTLDYLFHFLIKEVFKGRSYFDFGTSNENQGKNVNGGLLYWKECFGARAIVQQQFVIETIKYKQLASVFL
ncbi:MAG: GNAT family N-acetyltransferase [Flavobacteriaceae bacterium]